jgi:hypothetical protein
MHERTTNSFKNIYSYDDNIDPAGMDEGTDTLPDEDISVSDLAYKGVGARWFSSEVFSKKRRGFMR